MNPQPTSVWSALAVAQAVAGGIAWIDPTSFQPNVDALNLYWDSVNVRMHVKTAGDYGGLDAINAGAQLDSYVPNGFVMNTVGAAPGHTVSSSRGSRFAPLISINNDDVGLFGGYAYLQNGVNGTPDWYEVASMRMNVFGADAFYPGGRIRWAIKKDNGAITEQLQFRHLISGTFLGVPCFSGIAGTGDKIRLGTGNVGWHSFFLDYTDAGATGNIQIDKPSGSVQFAVGTQTIILTCNLLTVNSRVIATVATDDATAFACKAIPAAGTCTLKLNAACTAQTKVNFIIVGAD